LVQRFVKGSFDLDSSGSEEEETEFVFDHLVIDIPSINDKARVGWSGFLHDESFGPEEIEKVGLDVINTLQDHKEIGKRRRKRRKGRAKG